MSRMLLSAGVFAALVTCVSCECVFGQDQKGARIVGRVTDLSGWSLLPRVEITLRRYRDPRHPDSPDPKEEREELTEDIAYRTESDENGRFEIDGVTPRATYVLTAKHPGFHRGLVRRVHLLDDEHQVVDLGLPVIDFAPKGSVSIKGRVVNDSDNPVPDASVILSAPLRPDLVHRTRTDGEGRFELRVLDRAVWVLFAVKPGEDVQSGAMSVGPDGSFDGLELRLKRSSTVDRRP
jgi:hypothetical protein